MNAKLITTISIIALIIIAVLTNPKKEIHGEKLTKSIFKVESRNVMFKVASETLISQVLEYDNYVIFSIGNYEQIKSIGVFGNVFILSGRNEIAKSRENNNSIQRSKPNQNRNQEKKLKKESDDEKRRKLEEMMGLDNVNEKKDENNSRGYYGKE